MKKIIEYKVIYALDFKSLEAEVNEEIKKGWQPLGGIFIEKAHAMSFNQTMVRFEA